MDAVEFIKARERMCKSFDKCSFGCPAWDGSCKLETGTYLECEADKQVEIVKEWSAAHPIKTRQSEFLKQWPNADFCDDGYLSLAPCSIDTRMAKGGSCGSKCSNCRREFWMQEVE